MTRALLALAFAAAVASPAAAADIATAWATSPVAVIGDHWMAAKIIGGPTSLPPDTVCGGHGGQTRSAAGVGTSRRHP